EQKSLPDTEIDRISGKPRLIGGMLEGRALPLRCRQQSRLLTADVDAGELAVAEGRKSGRNSVDAHVRGQLIEENVGGARDRLRHVEQPARLVLVGTEQVATSRQVEGAVAEELLVRRDHMIGESDQAQSRFDRGA